MKGKWREKEKEKEGERQREERERKKKRGERGRAALPVSQQPFIPLVSPKSFFRSFFCFVLNLFVASSSFRLGFQSREMLNI